MNIDVWLLVGQHNNATDQIKRLMEISIWLFNEDYVQIITYIVDINLSGGRWCKVKMFAPRNSSPVLHPLYTNEDFAAYQVRQIFH